MIGEFLEFLGISFGFPFFDFQPLKAWYSLRLGTERYMTKPGGATFSCMRPLREFVYGPKVRRGQVILGGLDLALTKYFAGNCEQDPWPTKY